jgi:hypothetical protein
VTQKRSRSKGTLGFGGGGLLSQEFGSRGIGEEVVTLPRQNETELHVLNERSIVPRGAVEVTADTRAPRFQVGW